MIREAVYKIFANTLMIMLLAASSYGNPDLPTGNELLQKSQDSFQKLSFRAKISYMTRSPGGNQMREALVYQKAPDRWLVEPVSSMRERIVSRGRAMGRKPPMMRMPKEAMMRRKPRPGMQSNQIPKFQMGDSQLLAKNYNIQVTKGNSIANRNTYLLEILPELADRPSMKLWMDTETLLVLKMEKYSSQKWLSGFFVYSDIDIDPNIDDALFQKNGEGPDEANEQEDIWDYRQGNLDPDKIRKEADMEIAFPTHTPERFILQRIQIIGRGSRKNIHLVYTDGLAIISVFQSMTSRRRPERMREHMIGPGEIIGIGGMECEMISRGALLVFRWSQNKVSIGMVGELEQSEMIEFVKAFIENSK